MVGKVSTTATMTLLVLLLASAWRDNCAYSSVRATTTITAAAAATTTTIAGVTAFVIQRQIGSSLVRRRLHGSTKKNLFLANKNAADPHSLSLFACQEASRCSNRCFLPPNRRSYGSRSPFSCYAAVQQNEGDDQKPQESQRTTIMESQPVSKLGTATATATPSSSEKPFAVIVHTEILPSRLNEFLQLIQINAQQTRLEPECIRFDVLRSQTNPNQFFFYEVYKSVDSMEYHKLQPHYMLWANFKASNGTLTSITYKTDGEFLTP